MLVNILLNLVEFDILKILLIMAPTQKIVSIRIKTLMFSKRICWRTTIQSIWNLFWHETVFPIHVIDVRTQVDQMNPKKRQQFEKKRANPASAKVFSSNQTYRI